MESAIQPIDQLVLQPILRIRRNAERKPLAGSRLKFSRYPRVNRLGAMIKGDLRPLATLVASHHDLTLHWSR